MNWYWGLGQLLLDTNRALRTSTELRDEMENHIVQLYQRLLFYQMKTACAYHWTSFHMISPGLVSSDDWDDQLNGIKIAEIAVQRDAEQCNSVQLTYLNYLMANAPSQQRKLEEIRAPTEKMKLDQEKSYSDDPNQ
jgi:hypothetical protein